MAYALLQDMIDAYGEDAVAVAADRDGEGQIDQAAVDRELSGAESLINSYLRARYELPVSPVPDILKKYCVDIAFYQLSDRAGSLTDEKRRRYEDAVSFLKSLAGGAARLDSATPPPSSGGGVHVAGAERQFTREKMRGL